MVTIREQQDTASNSAAIGFTLGAATVVGDLLVVIQSNDYYAVSNLQTPTGTAASTWTLRHTLDGGTNDSHAKVWTAPVTTGGAQTVNINSSTTDEERYGGVWVLAGDLTFDTAGSTDGETAVTGHVAPSLTPTAGTTDALLICHFGTGPTGDINYTMPGGMTARTERDVVPFVTYRSADEQITSDVATGTRTATASAAREWFAVSVLITAVVTAAVPRRRLHVITRSRRGGHAGRIVVTAAPRPAPQSAALGVTAETDIALVLGAAKRVTVIAAGETDIALPLGRAKTRLLGIAAETDSALLLAGRVKTRGVGTADEVDTALAVGRAKARSISVAVEADTSLALTRAKTAALSAAVETDTAVAVTTVGLPGGPRLRVVTRARRGSHMVTAADPPGYFGAAPVTVGAATESDTAPGIGRLKTQQLGPCTETDTATSVGRAKAAAVTPAGETDTAVAVSVAEPPGTPRIRVVTRARRGAHTVTVTDLPGYFGAVPAPALEPATEADTALPLTAVVAATRRPPRVLSGAPWALQAHRTRVGAAFILAPPVLVVPSVALGVATETDTAVTISRVKARAVGVATETDAAQLLGRIKRQAAGVATETDAALPVGRTKTRTLGITAEADSAPGLVRGLSATLGIAAEVDTAFALGEAKRRALGSVTETDIALVVGESNQRTVSAAVETDTATALGRAKRAALGSVTETDTAEPVGAARRRVLTAPTETDQAQGLGRAKRFTVGAATETDLARPIGFPGYFLALGTSVETNTARTLSTRKSRAVGVATEVDTAGSLATRKRLALGVATEVDVAGSIPIELVGWPPLVTGPFTEPLLNVTGPFTEPLLNVTGPFTEPLLNVTGGV